MRFAFFGNSKADPMPYITANRRHAVNDWLTLVSNHVAGVTEVTICALADAATMPGDCGELNYALTMTCIGHKRNQFGTLDAQIRAIVTAYLMAETLRYQRLNDVVGALHCAALELERRRPGAKKFEVISMIYAARTIYAEMGIAYETKKIAENGDIDFGEAADAAALSTMRGK
jgi:hypothetical protein